MWKTGCLLLLISFTPISGEPLLELVQTPLEKSVAKMVEEIEKSPDVDIRDLVIRTYGRKRVWKKRTGIQLFDLKDEAYLLYLKRGDSEFRVSRDEDTIAASVTQKKSTSTHTGSFSSSSSRYHSYRSSSSYSYRESWTSDVPDVKVPTPSLLPNPLIEIPEVPKGAPNGYVFLFSSDHELSTFKKRLEGNQDVALPFTQTDDLEVSEIGSVMPTLGHYKEKAIFFGLVTRAAK